MGYYGITGWSGGGRRPINYGLKAGQFRTGKYNVFENKTIINNNVYTGGYMGGYNYGYFDQQCYNSTPKWMNWMMGLGLGTSFLGGILSMFGGGGKTEAGGEAPAEKQTQDSLAGLKEAFPDGKFVKITDNLYQGTVNGKTYDGTSIEDLYKNIKNGTSQDVDTKKDAPPVKDDVDDTEKKEEKDPVTNLFDKLGETLMAVDEQLGSKADISGDTQYTWEQNDGKDDKSKAPTQITITCSGKQYVFTKQNTTGDKITYKATSVIVNGQTNPVTNNQVYELDVASGKLIQKSGTTTAADGLGSTIKW